MLGAPDFVSVADPVGHGCCEHGTRWLGEYTDRADIVGTLIESFVFLTLAHPLLFVTKPRPTL